MVIFLQFCLLRAKSAILEASSFTSKSLIVWELGGGSCRICPPFSSVFGSQASFFWLKVVKGNNYAPYSTRKEEATYFAPISQGQQCGMKRLGKDHKNDDRYLQRFHRLLPSRCLCRYEKGALTYLHLLPLSTMAGQYLHYNLILPLVRKGRRRRYSKELT